MVIGSNMVCERPWTKAGAAFPCGRCIPCLSNRRRTWEHRIKLEASMHGSNSFLTLTYDESSLPLTTNSLATLEPKHLTDFLKRLRFALKLAKLRYYAVGEYGDESFRPHYHAIIFGLAPCLHGVTRRWRDTCCAMCELVREKWGHGRIESGEVGDGVPGYVASYVTKRMTRNDDPRLLGRYPEFARMSLRPGLGRGAMRSVALSMDGFWPEKADVPVSLSIGSKQLPLGRYLRRSLRLELGRDPKSMVETDPEMQALYESSLKSKTHRNFKEALVSKNQGKIDLAKARRKIWDSKRRKPL